MKVRINGEEREVAARSVAELLEELGLDPQKVAVERNASLVRRGEYADTAVVEGDELELVTLVGGG